MTTAQNDPAPLVPLHVRELRATGFARPEREAAALARVRHGSYLLTADWHQAAERERYLALLRATSTLTARPPLLSHGSAAAVWGLPMLGGFPTALHETVSGDASRSTPHLVRHRRASVPEAVQVGEFLVSSPARTVVDLAAERGFAAGVMAADRALHRGLCSLDDLVHEVAALGSARGCRAARDAVDLADGRCGWPGESLSRARFVECGLVVPEILVALHDDEGAFVGEVDFLWREAAMAGEFDGRVKYGRANPSGRPPEEVVWREKLREDRIRGLDLGSGRLGMVRWTWGTLLDPPTFRRYLLARGVPTSPRRRR